MPLPEGIETEADRLLYEACKEVASAVLSGPSGVSADLVDTLARKYLKCAVDHQDFVRGQREDDHVIERAVRYIARVHAIPPCGMDVAWFRTTLSTLIEVAVPNTGLDEETAALLPCLQEGIAVSLAQLPISREEMRLSDEDAGELARLRVSGVENGVVSELLDVVERLFHGDLVDAADKRLLKLAALSAPMVRHDRSSQ